MLTDFDPYDLLCRMQEELQYLRKMNLKTLKNQTELAAAYNDLKQQADEQRKLLIEIKHKHNKLVEQHRHIQREQAFINNDHEFETGRALR